MANSRHLPGRGAASSPESRFAKQRREAFDDGWAQEIDALPAFATSIRPERARSIVSRNRSPDVPFERSLGNGFAP